MVLELLIMPADDGLASNSKNETTVVSHVRSRWLLDEIVDQTVGIHDEKWP